VSATGLQKESQTLGRPKYNFSFLLEAIKTFSLQSEFHNIKAHDAASKKQYF